MTPKRRGLCLLLLGFLLRMPAPAVGAPAVAAAALPPATGPAVDLAAHRGEVVYLDFWASWCLPCRKSFPWMAEMQAKYRAQGLTVLTVNVDREAAAAARFLAALPDSLPVVFDPQGRLASAYGLAGMPCSFLYDRSGALRATHVGFDPGRSDEVERQIAGLLAEGVTDGRK